LAGEAQFDQKKQMVAFEIATKLQVCGSAVGITHGGHMNLYGNEREGNINGGIA